MCYNNKCLKAFYETEEKIEMDINTTLFVRYEHNDYVSKNIREKGGVLVSPYKKAATKYRIFRLLRRFHLKSKLPFKSIWYNTKEIVKYAKNLKDIIVFESVIDHAFYKHIKKHVKFDKYHVWYWNNADSTLNPKTKSLTTWEKSSFSDVDCSLYGMRHNPAFLFADSEKMADITPEFDVCFIGKNKGRYQYIKLINELLITRGFKTNFIVTEDRKYLIKRKNLSRAISYQKSIDIFIKSKVILDFILPANSGQSMRATEALFYSKKLITNNPLILKYDFYHKDNVFILGYDDFSRLDEFIMSPFNHIVDKFKENYTFEAWFKRFKQ